MNQVTSRPETETHLETLARLDAMSRELQRLSQELQARRAASPNGHDAKTARDDAALLAAVQGKSLWLPEAQKASGLTKQIATTAAKRLARARQIWLSLEPGPTGHLTWRLRSIERAAVDD